MSDRTMIPCDMIRDLLPAYARQATSSGTARMIEAHLDECPDCKARLAEIRGEAAPAAPVQPTQPEQPAQAARPAPIQIGAETRPVSDEADLWPEKDDWLGQAVREGEAARAEKPSGSAHTRFRRSSGGEEADTLRSSPSIRNWQTAQEKPAASSRLNPRETLPLRGETASRQPSRPSAAAAQTSSAGIPATRNTAVRAADTRNAVEDDTGSRSGRKKTHGRLIAVGVMAALLVLLCVVAVRFFVVGQDVSGGQIARYLSVSGSQIVFDGTAVDENKGLASVGFTEKDGVVTVTPRTVIATPLHPGSLHAEYLAASQVRRVEMDGQVLWADGKRISAVTSAVFAARHDSAQDKAMNDRLTAALALSAYLGDYSLEIKTETHPYEWVIQLHDRVSRVNRAAREKDMEAFACVLLGSVGDLEQVTFLYETEEIVTHTTTAAPTTQSKKTTTKKSRTSGASQAADTQPTTELSDVSASKVFTAESASLLLGQDVKGCLSDIRLLEQLMAQAGLDGFTFPHPADTQASSVRQITLYIFNASDVPLSGIHASMYRSGKYVSSVALQNEDGSRMMPGDYATFELFTDDFGQPDGSTSADDPLMFTLTAVDADGEEYPIDRLFRVPFAPGSSCRMEMIGSSAGGFNALM